jgi:hypothetical protein
MDGTLLMVDDDLPPEANGPSAARASAAGNGVDGGYGPSPVDGGGGQLRQGVWAARNSSAAHLAAAVEFPRLADAIAASQVGSPLSQTSSVLLNWCICLPADLSVCLSICLSVCLSFCLPLRLTDYLSDYLSVCL